MAANPQLAQVEQAGLAIMQDVLGPILNRDVNLTLAGVDEAEEHILEANFMDTPVVVEAPLEGVLPGTMLFIFSKKLAAAVTDLMVMGDGSAEFNEQESLDGISEATNQIVGALATNWGEELGAEVHPTGAKAQVLGLGELPVDLGDVYMVSYQLSIDDWGTEVFVKLVPKNILEGLLPLAGDAPPPQSQAGGEQQSAGAPAAAAAASGEGLTVRKAEFGEFDQGMVSGGGEAPRNLDLLMDISLPVTIELGRTNMVIREILELGPGSVIELQKLSGEPVDLYVNDKKFALGEVVVIDENFGVRITELLSVEDRIKALK